MKLIGMMMARNEAWCIGLTARVALQWCDELVVLDHASTDATREIVEQVGRECPGRVRMLCEDHLPHNEAQFRQRMLDAGRERGMTHGAIIDADELLTANLVGKARELAAKAHSGVAAFLPMRSPHESMMRYRVDPAFAEKVISVWFVDSPELCYCAEADGYHYHARVPKGTRPWSIKLENFGLEGGGWHLQTISRRRLEVKAACYKVLERINFPNRHSPQQLEELYGWTLRARTQTAPTPPEWIAGYRNLIDQHLDVECEPWQLHELRRLLASHPREMFSDLNLYGAA